MKTVILALALMQSSYALAAQGFELPSDATSLVPLKGELVEIRPICPPGRGRTRCMAIGTRVTLKFKLSGCLDVLAPVQFKSESIDGETHIFVSAQAVTRRASLVADCSQPHEKTETILISERSKAPVLHFLGAED